MLPSEEEAERAIERTEMEDELAGLEAVLAKRHLSQFARQAFPIIEPHVTLAWNWHLDVMCDELGAVSRGETEKLLINVPPGTMKSLLVSVMWPAWEWMQRPALKYLSASYTQDLATRDAMKMRDLVQSPWYRQACGVSLRTDQEAKTWFINTAGGWRIATTPGGKGTGEHPDRKIIDDPHSAQQARSETERKAAITWFDQTLSTRGAGRNAKTVIIMQRLHEEDLSGHVLAQGGWKHVMLPMRFEPKRAYSKDPRREVGELMWPEMFPEAKVTELERELSPYGAAGQFQQRPSPQGGGLFKREWFRIADRVPEIRDKDDRVVQPRRVRAWDVAATEGGGCFTAGAKVADCGVGTVPRFYVEDMRRAQLGPAKVDALILAVAAVDAPFKFECSVREEQEGGSAGKAVVTTRARDLAGYDYSAMPATGDKEVRARQFRSQAEAGNVAIVRGEWNEAFLSELESFPNGRYKDQVDATAHAFNDLITGPVEVRLLEVEWG